MWTRDSNHPLPKLLVDPNHRRAILRGLLVSYIYRSTVSHHHHQRQLDSQPLKRPPLTTTRGPRKSPKGRPQAPRGSKRSLVGASGLPREPTIPQGPLRSLKGPTRDPWAPVERSKEDLQRPSGNCSLPSGRPRGAKGDPGQVALSRTQMGPIASTMTSQNVHTQVLTHAAQCQP